MGRAMGLLKRGNNQSSDGDDDDDDVDGGDDVEDAEDEDDDDDGDAGNNKGGRFGGLLGRAKKIRGGKKKVKKRDRDDDDDEDYDEEEEESYDLPSQLASRGRELMGRAGQTCEVDINVLRSVTRMANLVDELLLLEEDHPLIKRYE